MQPRLMNHPALVVVGMQIITQPMSPEIPALWSRFVLREHEISGVLPNGVSYGVMQMDACDSGKLVYLAGLPVDDPAAPVPAGMKTMLIPAGQYAVFEFALQDINTAFGVIFNNWLPNSGHRLAPSPMFERYGHDFDPAIPSSRLEAYIPLASA